MRPLVCPHEAYTCGARSPDLELTPGVALKLKVNKFFKPDKTCYYHIFAKDKIKESDLPKYNMKYLQIYVEKLKGFRGWVAANTDIKKS
jgi:hypothetical protein